MKFKMLAVVPLVLALAPATVFAGILGQEIVDDVVTPPPPLPVATPGLSPIIIAGGGVIVACAVLGCFSGSSTSTNTTN